ncbi:nitrate- and nitrite sensing domain-containing protein [Streptacidiphilus sp. EB129]|uniref:sensor histidine kinase n=1 Tax=Streptacidiphilus sp. EB129 TaxID=3156262 RepID=UPI0035141390
MRFRSRSVRAKITALLLVPLASLTGLWAFTTVESVSQVWSQIQVSSDYRWFGTPADDLSRALQDERRAAVAYAAAPQATADQTTLQRAEAASDQQIAVFRSHAADNGRLQDLTAGQHQALNSILNQITALQGLRGQVATRQYGWDAVYQWYTEAQTPFFDLRLQLSNLQSGSLSREAADIIELVRAREYISREDALMSGARAGGLFSQSEFQEFTATSQGEQLLFTVHQPQLPQQEGALYQDFLDGGGYAALSNLEDSVALYGPDHAVHNIDAVSWQRTLNSTLTQLAGIDLQAATIAGDRASSAAMDVVWRDGAVGLVGLLAVLASVLVSLRIGRGLVRELVGLRDSAFDLAGVRLPDVMRRLRDGEAVDIAAEAPPVTLPSRTRDEVAQVGRAFDAVQRAAVQAAVEQAELRRGVAAVFLNLARRSQTLLHRQLTLLDAMERRVDDPDELEDLFRLDHLTTRMRRHAEGLIILSGAAPGRSWRRPVRILDVVRAAVGEVEDYARVRVHRMPPVAVVGGAVSDVVHLVAELVENAAVFSPPHTQVRIQGEQVAHGFVLEIDDRGLGMGEEALTAANDRLVVGGDFDLSDSDRLGLFVVSRLSARHGVRVSLRRSPYGGTTAVVLLPTDLITAVPARAGDASSAGRTGLSDETSELALPAARQRLGRELPRGGGSGTPTRLPGSTGPRHAAPRRESQHLELTPSTGPTSPTEPTATTEPTLASEATPVTGSTPATELAATESTADMPLTPATPLLPRRVRQASLAPALRSAPAVPGDAEPRPHPAQVDTPERERSPEEVRATFSSFQRGLSRGRADHSTDPVPLSSDSSDSSDDVSAEGPVS